MLAFLSYNTYTNATLFKPFTTMPPGIQSMLLQYFQATVTKDSSLQNTLTMNNYIYSFIYSNNNYFALIANSPSYVNEMSYILDHYKNVFSSDPFKNLYVINEVFPFTLSGSTDYNLIPVESLNDILKGESAEEKIYENMLKSKEIENYKKIKEMKKEGGSASAIEKQLERVRNLELEMRNEQLKQLEKLKSENIDTTKPVKRIRKIDNEGDFVVTIKEKLNVIVDKDNQVKECYVNGDLSVKIGKEEYKFNEIKFKNKGKQQLKYSPNINKSKTENNILFSDRGFPLNKNVALMKWKRNMDLPITFSFWINENNGKNMVQFEFECEKLKDIVFQFNKGRNVLVDGKTDNFEWRCGDSRDIEIICDEYEDIFPVKVDFWSDAFDVMVDVKKDEKIKIVKIFEVEKFDIVY